MAKRKKWYANGSKWIIISLTVLAAAATKAAEEIVKHFSKGKGKGKGGGRRAK